LKKSFISLLNINLSNIENIKYLSINSKFKMILGKLEMRKSLLISFWLYFYLKLWI